MDPIQQRAAANAGAAPRLGTGATEEFGSDTLLMEKSFPSGAKILIIDDEEIAIRHLSHILNEHGETEIESVMDASEAASHFKRFEPDLVILDLGMPGVSGLELLEMLRGIIPPGTYLPILIATGDASIEPRREALSRGASDFLVKPYDPVEILLRVGHLLTARFFHRQLTARNAELLTEVQHRRKAELAQKEAVTKAEEANLAKSHFLLRMSHELRTPLNAILGFAQLLEMDARSGEEADNVKQVLRGGQHLLDLINEVLDFAAVEAGRLAVALRSVRVSEAVGDAVNMVRPAATARNVTLGGFACDCHVLADPQRLKQILLNLLSNSIKYNREGGDVSFNAVETPDGMLRLMVCDGGDGIAKEDAGKLFKPFERLSASSTKIEGSGLGLAISKRLVELMGGRIGVESEPGHGCTFWIELPIAMTSEPGISSAKRTLLYIEDQASNLELMERVLKRRPAIRMVAAATGLQGLELARQFQPNLVLLDLNLPDINGDQVLERLQADHLTSSIPVVMISGYAGPAQMQHSLSAGARDYFPKPFDVQRLLSVVDKLLECGGEPDSPRTNVA